MKVNDFKVRVQHNIINPKYAIRMPVYSYFVLCTNVPVCILKIVILVWIMKLTIRMKHEEQKQYYMVWIRYIYNFSLHYHAV